jgi:hypothetical protein
MYVCMYVCMYVTGESTFVMLTNMLPGT